MRGHRGAPAVLAVAVLFHCVLLAASQSDRPIPFFFDSEVIVGRGCDFYALYAAGDHLRHGRSVYEEGPDTRETPCRFSFRYLPTSAWLGVPLSFLSPRAAYIAWILLIEAAFLGCLACVWRLCRGRKQNFAPLASIWLLATPMLLEVRLGQYNLIQAALVLAAATALRGESNRIADSALAASMVFKLNTWFAVPAIVRARRFRPLLVALGLLALTTLPHFLAHPDAADAFLENLRVRGTGAEHGFNRGNMSLTMLLKVILGAGFAVWMPAGIFALVFAGGLVATHRVRRMDLAAELVFWLALSLLAYKHTWEHHYLMALPALTLAGLGPRGARFWIAAALLVLPTPYFFFRSEWTLAAEILYHAWKPAGLALTLSLLARNR